jgi:hypothetical protein
LIGLVLASSIAVATLTAIGWYITGRWFAEWGTQVLLFSATLNLGACWISFVPIALVSRSRRDYLQQAALGAMVLRMLIALFGMLAAVLWGPWDVWPLSIWMLMFYLSLLAVETTMAVRLVSRTTGPME